VREARPSQSNYLALQGVETGDTINGNFKVLPAGTRKRSFAGNMWTYRRLKGVESAFTRGPVDENITIYILANQNYEGISFTFNLPAEDVTSLQQPVYFWNASEWGACNVTCGRGHQERGVACWTVYPGGRIEEVGNRSECSLLERPTLERECRMEQCQYRWRQGEWGVCDAVCGEGWKEREVWCERRPGDKVREELCQESTDKPTTGDTCHAPQPCSNFRWFTSNWSEVCTSNYKPASLLLVGRLASLGRLGG
jgi:hypothetical protein